jgi:hypothetical protein
MQKDTLPAEKMFNRNRPCTLWKTGRLRFGETTGKPQNGSNSVSSTRLNAGLPFQGDLE